MKINIRLIFLFTALCVTSKAQGVHFDDQLTWNTLLEKAKATNKFIFIDCNATWCAPCKLMDSEVFSSTEVGDAINSHFVSIHLQMDSTKNDDAKTRSRYTLAKKFKSEYQISAMPTFLYFSSDGKLVHRFSGALKKEDFVKVSLAALDQHTQYIYQVNQFRLGKKDYAHFKSLASAAQASGQLKLADSIARDYITYSNNLSNTQLLGDNYLSFVFRFAPLIQSTDRIFKLLFTNGNDIDQTLKFPHFSEKEIEYVINKEEIEPKLKNLPSDNEPDWTQLIEAIRSKYPASRYQRLVNVAKSNWFDQHGMQEDYYKAFTELNDRFGVDTVGIGKAMLNNVIWEKFVVKCKDPVYLLKAASWMERVIAAEPSDGGYKDTYANLLYKAGQKEKAIIWEEKAIAASRASNNSTDLKSFEETLGKMKKNLPTWE